MPRKYRLSTKNIREFDKAYQATMHRASRQEGKEDIVFPLYSGLSDPEYFERLPPAKSNYEILQRAILKSVVYSDDTIVRKTCYALDEIAALETDNR